MLSRLCVVTLCVVSVMGLIGCPKPPATSTVPNVVGMTQPVAEGVLEAAGLALGAATEEYNAQLSAGRIISQLPLPAAVVPAGTHVAIVLSKGPVPPTAAFQATPTAGTVPLTVAFEDLSVAGDGAIDSWTWDFGDGTSSQDNNPTHTYTEIGIYTVSLTVRSGNTGNEVTYAGFINAAPTVQAAFEKLANPDVPATEAADDLFAAMDAVFKSGGLAGIQQELNTARFNYLNSGGDLRLLNQRSALASPTSFSLADVQQRRLLKSETGSFAKRYGIDWSPASAVTSLNVIVYINGINTDYTQGMEDYYALAEATKDIRKERDSSIAFVWNPHAAGLAGTIWDLLECNDQKITEIFSAVIPQGDPKVVSFAQYMSDRINGRNLAERQNLVIVSHSQGNFYTEQAVRLLNTDDRQHVSVIEVASPVDIVPVSRNDYRIDIESDPVPRLCAPFRRGSNGLLPYEGGSETASYDWVGSPGATLSHQLTVLIAPHSFRGAYLVGQARERLREKVKDYCEIPTPAVTAFSVNSGCPLTSTRVVMLNNACRRSPTEYMASERSDFADAHWSAYSPAPTFEIQSPGDGTKTIYFKVRNVNEVESLSVHDQVNLQETTGPVIASVSPDPVPGLNAVQTITINGSGFSPYCSVRLRNKSANSLPLTCEPDTITADTLTLSRNFGTDEALWTAQVINSTMAQSAEVYFGVTTSSEAPTARTVVINAGAVEATSNSVTLHNVCLGNPTHYKASESPTFDNDAVPWQPYSNAPHFLLSTGDETKTVYFKVANAAGESAVISDTITLNVQNVTEYVFDRTLPESPGPWHFTYPWGVAVDASGNVYVADTENSCIQKFTAAGAFLVRWGSYGQANGQFCRPQGIAVDASGNVYVADTGNHRIQKFTSIGSFFAAWGTFGSGDSQFVNPGGVAVDASGNVYVADTGNNRIQKFTATGTYLAKKGTFGSGDGQFNSPFSVAVDASGNIYVADTYNQRIQKFSAEGVFLTKWNMTGSGDAPLFDPYCLAVDAFGNVYVADFGNHRIQKFTDTGVFLGSCGMIGSADGELFKPSGVAVDASGNVYVADTNNNRIQKFTANGGFLANWGTIGSGAGQFIGIENVAVDASGNVYATDLANNRIQKLTATGAFITQWGSYGSGNGQFDYPNGLAVDASGNVYVTERLNSRIQKFTSTGAFLAKWGSYGFGEGQFCAPRGAAIDASGNVYVADWGNHRIQKFTTTGDFLTKWGSSGHGTGQLYYPSGVAVDVFGNVYVADTNNDRIQKFTADGVFLAQWGSLGQGYGQFFRPTGVAVDLYGNVYVADTLNDRIQKFSANGTFLATWGTFVLGPDELEDPAGLAVDVFGNVYIADTGNQRIQRFVPQ